MSSTVRGIVMRALFEPDFHNLLVSNPDQALKGYNLTDAEIDALRNPSAALYRFLQPGTDVLGSAHAGLIAGRDGGEPPPPPPPPPVTVTVIIVVAIIVFVAAAVSPTRPSNVAKYAPLIDAIHQSSGPARFDLVKTLVNELTKDQ